MTNELDLFNLNNKFMIKNNIKYWLVFNCALALIFFATVKTYAQQTVNDSKENKSKNAQYINIAREEIKELKSSVLLVRLHTKTKSIEALRKVGNIKLADKIEQEQSSLNLRIINAFKSDFNFCPVYFFFSDESKYILSREFDSISFINANLLPDKSIKPEIMNFFIAEFGSPSQDTTQYYSHTTYEANGDFSAAPVQHYSGGAITGAEGLIIKDSNFYQVRKPFPSFVKYPFFAKKTNTEIKCVAKMNLKLTNFYNN